MGADCVHMQLSGSICDFMNQQTCYKSSQTWLQIEAFVFWGYNIIYSFEMNPFGSLVGLYHWCEHIIGIYFDIWKTLIYRLLDILN